MPPGLNQGGIIAQEVVQPAQITQYIKKVVTILIIMEVWPRTEKELWSITEASVLSVITRLKLCYKYTIKTEIEKITT
jgi:hypothetical protein